MDQAVSADQIVLRHLRERGQDSDMDRHLGLRDHRHHQEKLDLDQSLGEILQIFSVTLFEKIELSRLFSECHHQINRPIIKIVDAQRYLTGHQ